MRRSQLATALLLPLFFGCSATLRGAGVDDGGSDASAGPCGDGAAAFRCGDRCVDVTSDVADCGRCGSACDPGAKCCSGTCVTTDACSFAVTSLDPDNGWQNGGGWLSLHGAGFVAGMKVFLGTGRAPARVLDDRTATIQIPPGPLGRTSVRIVAGGATATLDKGFTYIDGQLGSPWAQKPLAAVRGEDPALAVLQDGRVLVAGGTRIPDSVTDAHATAELYSRDDDKVTPAAGPMSNPRWQNSAVTLVDGRVLVVGAACFRDLTKCQGDPRSADLFDPTTRTFRPTAMPMNLPRVYTRAVLLVDGRVLVVSANDPSAEIYDPATDTFTRVTHNVAHPFGFMVRLRDGRVLVGGGDGGEKRVEAFDPDLGFFTQVNPLNQARAMLTAHTLPDGRAIVIGGADQSAGGIHLPLDTAETFDPATNQWTLAPFKLSQPRAWHASALVRDGTILVMGGYTVDGKCDSLTASVDQIDPVLGKAFPFAMLPNKNTEWTAVTLLDGSVLGVGGGACGATMALPDIDFLPGGPG